MSSAQLVRVFTSVGVPVQLLFAKSLTMSSEFFSHTTAGFVGGFVEGVAVGFAVGMEVGGTEVGMEVGFRVVGVAVVGVRVGAEVGFAVGGVGVLVGAGVITQAVTVPSLSMVPFTKPGALQVHLIGPPTTPTSSQRLPAVVLQGSFRMQRLGQ